MEMDEDVDDEDVGGGGGGDWKNGGGGGGRDTGGFFRFPQQALNKMSMALHKQLFL